MNENQRKNILCKAILASGKEAQIDRAIEQMAELARALCKLKRAQDGPERGGCLVKATEEVADVQIMLDGLRIILGPTADIEAGKLLRREKRLQKLGERSRKDGTEKNT